MATRITFSSAFDIADEIFRKMCDAVVNEGGTGDDLRTFAQDRERLRQFAKLVVVERRQLGDTLRVQIPALKRPTLEQLQAKYPWVKQILRDDSTEEAVTITLTTVLEPDEERINGKTYEARLATLQGKLGFQHRQWLMEHQGEFPEFIALLGKIYIDFSGILVLREGGHRLVPCLSQDDERWSGHWCWVDNDFLRNGRVAVSCK